MCHLAILHTTRGAESYLFEQYGNQDFVIVDIDNEGDEDDQVRSLMPSQLHNETNQFQDDLV